MMPGHVGPWLVGPQPRRRLVDPGDGPELHGRQVGQPAVDLALVEALGPCRIPRGPVPASRPSRAWRSRRPARRPGLAGRRGRRRRGPARWCPLGWATSRRRTPSGRSTRRSPSGSSQPAIARACGTSVPASAASSRYSRSIVSLRPLGTTAGRTPQGHAVAVPGDLEELVGGAAGDEAAGRAARPARVGPGRPSSARAGRGRSRCRRRHRGRLRRPVRRPRVGSALTGSPPRARGSSANFSRAAATRSGRCSVGHRPGAGLVALQHLAGHGHPVHLGRPVDQSHDRGRHPHRAQRHLVGDPQRPVHLDGPLHDVVQHLRGEHLDGGDVVADPRGSRWYWSISQAT